MIIYVVINVNVDGCRDYGEYVGMMDPDLFATLDEAKHYVEEAVRSAPEDDYEWRFEGDPEATGVWTYEMDGTPAYAIYEKMI